MKGNFTLFRTLLFILIGFPASVFGQQPEQDCINAIPVCQNIYNQPNSYSGAGLLPSEINGTLSCLLSGELNSVWYIFTVQTAGNVCFSITPNNPTNDYDWAVYDLTNNPCSDIASIAALEVSCNYSPNIGCGGVTGPNGNNMAPAPAGCFGQNESCIPVNVGETYVVNVSNFSTLNQNGYTLDFSQSTAVIFDNVPPEIDSVTADCGGNITVRFSENIVCSSVDPTDFMVTGPGGPYTVTTATGLNCTGGSFEIEFDLTVTPPTTVTGTYFISLIDTVLDNCGNVGLYTTDSVDILLPALVATASSDSVCDGSPVTLSTQSFPNFTYTWTGGAGSGPMVTTIPTTSSLYTVTATDAAGCVFSGNVLVEVLPNPTATFAAFPTSVCPDDPLLISFTGDTLPGGATFIWNFAGGNIINGTDAGPYNVAWPAPGLQSPSLTVSQYGCQSTTFSSNVTIFEIPTSDFTADLEICASTPGGISYTGTASTGATYSWELDGGTIVSGAGAGPYQVQWATSGQKNICLTVIENGCTSETTCSIVTVRASPDATIKPVDNQCLKGNDFTFRYGGNSTIMNYAWDFGEPNGNSNFPIPNYQYQSQGTKIVSLTVTDDLGCEGTGVIVIDIYPNVVADFTFDPTCAESEMQITDASTFEPTSPIVDWFWNFENTLNSTDQNPITTFDIHGFLPVKLIITSVDGCKDTIRQNVTVYPKPEVSFTYMPTCALDETPFTSTSTIDDIIAADSIENYIWDFGDGTIVEGTIIPTHAFSIGGLKNVTLTAVSDKGCETSLTEEVDIYLVPDPPNVKDDIVCFGEQALLRTTIEEPGKRVEWFDDENSTISIFDGFNYTTSPLAYWQTYYVEAVSGKNCRSDRVQVQGKTFNNSWGTIQPSAPEVELPNSAINFDLIGATHIAGYQWSFGDGGVSDEKNPTYVYAAPGRYEVKLDMISVNGCENQLIQIVYVKGIREVHVPTAFSPNGDGINDFFTLGYNLISSVEFHVYNRWGQEVFMANTPDFQWDGRTNSGKAAREGVYTWYLSAEDVLGQPIQKMGTLTIIR